MTPIAAATTLRATLGAAKSVAAAVATAAGKCFARSWNEILMTPHAALAGVPVTGSPPTARPRCTRCRSSRRQATREPGTAGTAPGAGGTSAGAAIDTSAAPKSWRADERAHYDQLPPEIKNAAHRREQEMAAGVFTAMRART